MRYRARFADLDPAAGARCLALPSLLARRAASVGAAEGLVGAVTSSRSVVTELGGTTMVDAPRALGAPDWRLSYADIGPGEIEPLEAVARSSFVERGLSARTAREYARAVASVERCCRERGTTALAVDAALLSGIALRLSLPVRAQTRSALWHWWAVLGRVDPPLDAVRVAGREAHLGTTRQAKGRGAERPQRADTGQDMTSESVERIGRARTEMRRAGLNATSARQYCRYLAQAERWCASQGCVLETVDGETLERFADGIPRSTSSRRAARTALGYYFRALGRVDPPLWAVRVPRKRRMIAQPLEPDEVARLMVAVRENGEVPGFAVLLGLFLGLRRFEIAAVRFADFSGGWLDVLGKGDLPARLPVHAEVTTYLGQLERRSEFVFAGTTGGHVSPTTVWNWVVQLGERAGIEGLTTHRLRHTCLTYANDATRDLRAVQEFARHERPETTAGYTRASADRLREIVRALGVAFAPDAPGAESQRVAGVPGPSELGAPARTCWSMSLEDVVTGCSGAQHVGDWVALGALLAGREGWRLTIAPDLSGTLGFHFDAAKLWVSVDDMGVRPTHRFVVYVAVGPTEDDVDYWTLGDIDSLGALLATFEAGGARAIPASGKLGPHARERSDSI